MLIFNLQHIGTKLLAIRKKTGFTQSEIAERAGIADRTYADIERGSVNMRIETLMKICQTLDITPDDILTEHPAKPLSSEELAQRLQSCSQKDRQTALSLMDIYLHSLNN